MKTFKNLFVFVIVTLFGIASILSVSAKDVDYIIGTEHAETSEYYNDFISSMDEIIGVSNFLLEEYPMEDGTPRTISATDVDFTKMIKLHKPTEKQLQQALETEFSEIPETWDYMWILPIPVDDYIVHLYYTLGCGIEESHLLKAEDGTPMLTEEELAAIASREGHFTISSGYVSTSDSFESYVLSQSTVDMEFVKQICYMSVSTIRSRAVWIHTEKGNTFYLTNCDDNPVSTASVFTIDTQSDGMTQDEFRRMINETFTEEQAGMANYHGEDVYGASNVPDVVTVSDMVLPALIFAVTVTGVFITVLYFRRHKTV